MVKILDGEILQDDDPRFKERQQQQYMEHIRKMKQKHIERQQAAGHTVQAQEQSQNTNFGFDFSAPPFKLVPAQPGENPFGWQDVQVYGMRFKCLHVLILLATLLLGWRGLTIGVIIYIVYQINKQPPQQEATAPHGQGFAATNQQNSSASFQQFLQKDQGQMARQGQGRGSEQRTSDHFKGKGHKLGSS